MKPQTPHRNHPLVLRLTLALAACIGLCAQTSNAQTQNPTAASQTPTPAQTAPGQTPAASAGGATKLIKIDAVVLDRDDKFVANLRAEDFRVEEEGVTQSITHFTTESSPLTYSLLVDNTGSMRSMLDRVLQTGGEIIAGKREPDEMSVVRFVSRDKIQLMQDFTRNRNALAAALDEMYVEGGETAMLEALYVAAEAVVERAPGDDRRRALIVITDGGERDPRTKLDEVLTLLQKHHVQVFVFSLTEALGDDAFRQVKGGRRRSRELLEKLARDTGGHAVFPKNASEFAAAALALNAQLQMPRYTLGYTSSAPASKKPLKIEVKLADSARRDGMKLHSSSSLKPHGGVAVPARK